MIFNKLNFKLLVPFSLIGAVLFLSAVIPSREPVSELDDCFHVFLDVGSNVGIQVRKLYELDNKFPTATITQWYEKFFGPHTAHRNKMVCTVGFEPNIHHTPSLRNLEASHKKCGWRTKFFTETAASHDTGITDFFLEVHEDFKKEMGATIINEEKNFDIYKISKAKKIRLADYILQKVVPRKIPEDPNSSLKPSVVMKMDIEGSELELLVDLLISGALQYVDKVLVEYHEYFKTQRSADIRTLRTTLDWLTKFGTRANLTSKIDVQYFDDESYFETNFTLPQC